MHAHTCIPSCPLSARLHPPLPPTHCCTSTPPTLWFVLFVQLKLLLKRTYLQKCKQQWSKHSITYLRTYIQTDRQTDRERCTVSPCQLSLSPRAWPSVSPAHTQTHNEDHDTHQVGSMSSQPKATPLSHFHTKQHTEGGRVQLPHHHVKFLLPPPPLNSSLPSSLPPLSSLVSIPFPPSTLSTSPHIVTVGWFHGVHRSHKLAL